MSRKETFIAWKRSNLRQALATYILFSQVPISTNDPIRLSSSDNFLRTEALFAKQVFRPKDAILNFRIKFHWTFPSFGLKLGLALTWFLCPFKPDKFRELKLLYSKTTHAALP